MKIVQVSHRRNYKTESKLHIKKKSEIQDTNFSLSSIIKLTDDEDNSAAADQFTAGSN